MNTPSSYLRKAKLAVIALALPALLSVSQATPITQTLTNLPAFNYPPDGASILGSVSLVSGTNVITNLSSVFTVADQGWGYQDPGNGVWAFLSDGTTNFASILLAGTSHVGDTFGAPYQWNTRNYTASVGDLAGFNSTLSSYNWANLPGLSINIGTNPYTYPGWELHVQSGGSFSVTSNSVGVPDGGTTLSMLGITLLGLVAWRRKSAV